MVLVPGTLRKGYYCLLKSPHPSLGGQSYHPAKTHSLVPSGLTLRSCHYASGVGEVQEDRREGWVQEVEVVKARRLSSWGVILATVTEKDSEGDYISNTTPSGTGEQRKRLQSAPLLIPTTGTHAIL